MRPPLKPSVQTRAGTPARQSPRARPGVLQGVRSDVVAPDPAVSRTGVAPDSEKLQKVLARSGIGSRRAMESLIAEGRVEVNGVPATLGQRVSASDRIAVDKRPVRYQAVVETPQVILYHKPVGELVTAKDPEGRPTVFDRLPRLKAGRWIAIGRLDFNTSGLLLLTDSGELANQLMHPRHQIEREYAVRIVGELSRDQERALKDGIELDDGPAKFDSVHFKGGEGSNRWYEVTLREGRNREVRRMFETLGVTVSRLVRIRFGSLRLPPRLPVGRWMPLEEKAISDLVRSSSLP